MSVFDGLRLFYGPITASGVRVVAEVELPAEGEPGGGPAVSREMTPAADGAGDQKRAAAVTEPRDSMAAASAAAPSRDPSGTIDSPHAAAYWGRAELRGTIEGPFCRAARTLPASSRLQPVATGDRLRAEALVVEPCLWSVELPHLYRVRLALDLDGRELAQVERWLGLRPWVVRGRKLLEASRNWVVRAGRAAALDPESLQAWAGAATGLIVHKPEPPEGLEALMLELSRQGTMAVVVLGESGSLPAVLRRLNALPAATLVVLPASIAAEAKLRNEAPNLLLAAVAGSDAPLAVVEAADVVVVPIAELGAHGEELKRCDRPVMALRREGAFGAPGEARRACDRLQRELAAGDLDWAGYLIDAQ